MATYLASAEDSGTDTAHSVPRRYAWVVFALTFGLLLPDFMSRQVLTVVFPQLKAEWGLSDSELGALSGVVAIAVGVLAFPLSVVADRLGRIRSLILMATIWSFATLMCGFASDYQEMFVARFFIGVGEAAYGSVGLAVVLSIFPPQQRSTITGAFLAGSMVGSVLGIGLGGVLATHFGWRASFVGMAIYGIGLTVVYALVVRPGRLESPRPAARAAACACRPPSAGWRPRRRASAAWPSRATPPTTRRPPQRTGARKGRWLRLPGPAVRRRVAVRQTGVPPAGR